MASEILASSCNSNSSVKIDIDSPPNPESVANNQPSNTCTNNQHHPREREENSPQTGRPRAIHEKEAKNLLDVEEGNTPDGKTLKKGLEIWERDLHVQQKRLDRKEAQSNQIKNEVYQLVGFFIVFQGVLYTAVAQAQVLRCLNWPTVFVLSLLASAAAILGVSQKLSQLRALWRTIEKEEHMPKILKKWVRGVRGEGLAFDFTRESEEQEDSKSSIKSSITWYSALVILILVLFAITFAVSFPLILCHPGSAPPS
ncbi:unnamed protein product [Sphagnum jensenii]|uniref:Transmembrane protein n=1 Tax=Sphagnum jensenii TaxID=128206 RepID=A0ABP1BFS7_9BRYO